MADDSSGAIQEAQRQIDEMVRKQADAATKQADAANKATESSERLSKAVKKSADSAEQESGLIARTFKSLVQFGVNTTVATSGFKLMISEVYGAEGAFTSLIPTVDAVEKTFNSMADIIGTGLSNISGFSFSLGKAPEGLAKAASQGMSIITNLFRQNLTMSQKLADTFVTLSKSGVMFGTGLEDLRKASVEAGIPMQAFAKFIPKHIEQLSTLGGSTVDAAVKVGKLANAVGKQNQALLAQYGSYDALAEGITEYLALQAKVGIDAQKRDKDVNKSASEYLMVQKELTQLTGKNAETLRKEEEARRSELDYQMRIAQLQPQMQDNMRAVQGLFGKINEDAAKYATEYFATGGRITNKTMLEWRAFNKELANVIEQSVNVGITQPTDQFKQSIASIIKSNYESMIGDAKLRSELASINRGAQNENLTQITKTTAGLLAAKPFFDDLPKTFADMETIRQQQKAGLDTATKGYIDAINAAKDRQQQLDQVVMNNMSNMSNLIKFLSKQQEKQIKVQAEVNDSLTKMVNGTGNVAEAMVKILDVLMQEMGVYDMAKQLQEMMYTKNPKAMEKQTGISKKQITAGQAKDMLKMPEDVLAQELLRYGMTKADLERIAASKLEQSRTPAISKPGTVGTPENTKVKPPERLDQETPQPEVKRMPPGYQPIRPADKVSMNAEDVTGALKEQIAVSRDMLAAINSTSENIDRLYRAMA